MPREFARPAEGFPFIFGGLRTNDRADMMTPIKYPVAVNIRQYTQNQIRTRPGIVKLFDAGSAPSTDLRAYTALQTDDLPRILLRDILDHIWLDNGVQVGSLTPGFISSPGATFIPFRPAASPTPWMYIANGSDYQKFSSPTATNVVVQNKVGIAEPQASVEAFPFAQTFQQFLPTTVWTAAGTATGNGVGSRSSDTITTAIQDPACASLSVTKRRWSLFVSTGIPYQIGEVVTFFTNAGHTLSATLPIEDVIPPLGGTLTIQSIYFFTGSTGRCVIVLGGTGTTQQKNTLKPAIRPLPAEPNAPLPGGSAGGVGVVHGPNQPSGSGPQGSALNQAAQGLRRGALIQLNTGGGTQEIVYVNSVTEGPNNTVCIEAVTANGHAPGEPITALPTIIVNGVPNGQVPQPSTITGDSQTVTTAVTTGIGTLTAVMNQAITALPLDYFHFSVKIDVPSNVAEIRILLDVGDGSFTQNYYYYVMAPSDLAADTTGASTQGTQLAGVQNLLQRDAILAEGQLAGLSISSQGVTGASQWTEIWIPLSSFTRVGGDTTLTIYNAAKMQIQFNAVGSIAASVSSITAVGGGNPDIGDIGEPYHYRIRPKSSITGVVGNSSPDMRYGCASRRQQNLIIVPTTYPDAQVDTWEVFRFGGSVTSWRYVGFVNMGVGVFTDNFDDPAAQAGDLLDFDNFEPWPTIDIPLTLVTNPFGYAVTLVGTVMKFALSAPNNNLGRYLPGNLIQINPIVGQGIVGPIALTLRERPTTFDGGTTWLFEFVECGGSATGANVNLYEPEMANQPLPYMWGPDVNGTIFAVGDPLRAGTLYFAKGNNPDSAPDSFNIEIVPPSEPLQGGEVVDGLSFVASTERWWALYPQPDNPLQRYNFVQTDDTRGLAAPFGHCTDGKSRFWYARDGIYSSSEGSLTDADLFNLFPHDGVLGETIIYNGVTLHPPAYSRATQFRLSYANGFLYATYVYIGNSDNSINVTLVLNLRTKAWSVDQYGGTIGIQNVYQIEQRPGSAFVPNPTVLMLGTQSAGSIATRAYKQVDFSNDNGVPIACNLSTFEFDGGDKRAPKQWGDFFLDCLPTSAGGIIATPVSLGAGVAPPSTVPQSATRVRAPLSVGGIVVSDFLGLFLGWTDDFSGQSVPTVLYLWQPSLDLQPARELAWTSFGSGFGGKGYQHLRQIDLAWVSTQPVTITAVPFDGQAPAPIVVPSSGGAYKKVLFPFSANKGLLYSFTVSSPAPFQIFNDDTELYVGEWGRQEGYQVFRGFGGRTVDDAPI